MRYVLWYSLVSAVIMLYSCGNYPTQDLLDAKFLQVDTNPPVFSTPQDTVVASGPLLLQFTAAAGAAYYELHLSAKDDFSERVAGIPQKLPINAFLFEPPDARTYYARVRANTTRKGEYSPTLRFHVLKGVMRVYCAQSETTCAAGEGFGSKDIPLKNIAYAMERAASLGISEVQVASRGGTAAYQSSETLLLYLPLKVRGGYHPDTWEYNPAVNTTRIENNLTETVRVHYTSSTNEYGLDGFRIRNTGSSGTGYAVYIEGSQGQLTLGNNEIIGPAGSNNFAVYAKNGTAKLKDNTITGGSGSSNNTAIQANNATVFLENNTITGGTAGNSWAVYGENNATLDIKQNTITGATAGSNARGIVLVLGADAFIEDNVISAGTATTLSAAIRVDDSNCLAVIQRNRIEAGNGNQNTAVAITSGSLQLYNNMISARGGTGTARGVDISLSASQPTARLYNNTIYHGNSGTSYGVYLNFGLSNNVQLINNLITGENTANNVCVFENNTNDLFYFQNNNLSGCQNLYRDHDASAYRNSETDLNNHTLTCNGTGCTGGNTSQNPVFLNAAGADSLLHTLADNDWQLSATSHCNLRYGGKNLLAFGVTLDLLKNSRTASLPASGSCSGNVTNGGHGFSMGAFEFSE